MSTNKGRMPSCLECLACVGHMLNLCCLYWQYVLSESCRHCSATVDITPHARHYIVNVLVCLTISVLILYGRKFFLCDAILCRHAG